MQLIEHYQVPSGGVSSIVFDEIPDTFTDLVLKINARTNANFQIDNLKLAFNGSTSSFSGRVLFGNGTSVSTATNDRQAGVAPGNNSTASTFSSVEIYIPNYRSSANKSYSYDAVGEQNATYNLLEIYAGLWSNSAAISSITITSNVSATIVQHSSATLYGITAGSDGIVAVS
jgi:uncharacterized membrane protein